MAGELDFMLPRADNPDHSYRWGLITSASPLAVILDGDLDPLEAMPDNVSGFPLEEGQRVLVLLLGGSSTDSRRPIILGSGPGSIAPALPEPFNVTGADVNDVIATAWTDFPNWTITTSLVLPHPAWVKFEFTGWLTTTPTATVLADCRVGIALTGATTSPPNSPNWGAVAYRGTTAGGSTEAGNVMATKTVLLNAGTTIITPRAYKTSAAVTARFNYPTLTVNPQRWAA